MKRILVLVVLLASCQFAIADFDSAKAAYDRDDYKTAFIEFKPLAEQGNAKAQTSLGAMYLFGLGVPQDDAKAVRWYRLAADQGVAKAQSNLGFMYFIGKGVTKNDAEAVKWYRRAADQGYARAQNNLGLMYANGLGVLKDYVQAYAWWNIAATQGDEDARKAKPLVAQMMTPSQIAKAQELSKELWEKIPRQ